MIFSYFMMLAHELAMTSGKEYSILWMRSWDWLEGLKIELFNLLGEQGGDKRWGGRRGAGEDPDWGPRTACAKYCETQETQTFDSIPSSCWPPLVFLLTLSYTLAASLLDRLPASLPAASGLVKLTTSLSNSSFTTISMITGHDHRYDHDHDTLNSLATSVFLDHLSYLVRVPVNFRHHNMLKHFDFVFVFLSVGWSLNYLISCEGSEEQDQDETHHCSQLGLISVVTSIDSGKYTD